MHLTVAIATTGRRELLSHVLELLLSQTRLPDLIAICPAKAEDVDEAFLGSLPVAATLVRTTAQGSGTQRNAILRAVSDTDLIVFFDDDFVPALDYLEQCEAAFVADPELVMLTGEVLADGVHTPGIPLAEAHRILAADQPPAEGVIADIYNCYGCNMAVRAKVARRETIEFDENLPLYAWLEDVDFSRRMLRFGRVMKSNRCRGVHLATKKGKGSGIRLGYSQVANPIYLWRKRSLGTRRALAQLGRNVGANLRRAARPEPWIDRRGRLTGNLLAFGDALTGKLHPRRITAI